MALPESAAAFLASQIERLRHVKPKRRIVFPEGDDARVQSAAERLQREGLVTPILLKPARPAPEHDRFRPKISRGNIDRPLRNKLSI